MVSSLIATTTPTEAPLPSWVPLMVMVVGLIMLGMLFTVSIRAKIAKRSAAPRRTPREIVSDAREDREKLDRVDAAASRLLESAQRLAAQLDNKARRLEALLEEADDRIRSLETLDARPLRPAGAAGAGGGGDTDTGADTVTNTVTGAVTGPDAVEVANTGADTDAGTDTDTGASERAGAGRGQDAGAPPHVVRTGPAPPAVEPVALDPLTRSVYDLADEGLAVIDIARALDEQVGKVELILALRRGGAA